MASQHIANRQNTICYMTIENSRQSISSRLRILSLTAENCLPMNSVEDVKQITFCCHLASLLSIRKESKFLEPRARTVFRHELWLPVEWDIGRSLRCAKVRGSWLLTNGTGSFQIDVALYRLAHVLTIEDLETVNRYLRQNKVRGRMSTQLLWGNQEEGV
jgi:hypothetical protein